MIARLEPRVLGAQNNCDAYTHDSSSSRIAHRIPKDPTEQLTARQNNQQFNRAISDRAFIEQVKNHSRLAKRERRQIRRDLHRPHALAHVRVYREVECFDEHTAPERRGFEVDGLRGVVNEVFPEDGVPYVEVSNVCVVYGQGAHRWGWRRRGGARSLPEPWLGLDWMLQNLYLGCT